MTQESTAFKAEMESKFGSDAALGVKFELEGEDGPGEIISLEEFNRMAKELGDDMPGASSLLPHGGSAVCCTDYATHIYLAMPGRVQIFGFANEENPTSRCAREQFHCGGHDFAVVDDRYIVDPWPRLVPSVLEDMTFDLQDAADAALALDIYGPRHCWTHMVDAEAYANTLKN